MVRSLLRKDKTKIITTDKELGWDDRATIVDGASETGGSIYQIPRKSHVKITYMAWHYGITQDPTDVRILFAVMPYGVADGTLQDAGEFFPDAIVNAVQNWRVFTEVGVVETYEEKELDLDFDIQRDSNLSLDDDYAIVPIYRATNAGVTVGQGGIMRLTEKLTQVFSRDDPQEWAGYTWEESAS